MRHSALLCVSFGTTVPQAMEDIILVEEALKAAAPERDFFRAFTSPTVCRILARRGEPVDTLSQALDRLEQLGYQELFLQPTHLLYGLEYDRIEETCRKAAGRFSRLRLGKPLLAGQADLDALAQVLSDAYPPQAEEALVLMGHGTPHFSNTVYPALQTVFRYLGREDLFIGTVEGWPEVGTVVQSLEQAGYRRAHLLPLMLVAGDHAQKDMAGPGPESWKSILEARGIRTRATLQGLGRLEGVRQLYCRHLAGLLEEG